MHKLTFILLSTLCCSAFTFAQTPKPVSITVSSTEYDNPGLTALKEYLKTNTKVRGVKSLFSNAVATLNFTYIGEADELWDEVPADKKQAFKLSFIDSKSIKLQAIKNQPATANTAKTDPKNCGCDYFPLCKFDKSRSFKGETWKGIDDDGKLIYYHCENGILRAKKELFDNFEGNSLGFETYTALKYNEPNGTQWKETIDFNGAKFYYTHSITQKGIRISINGKNYNDVIKVRHIKEGASLFYQGAPQNLMQIENRDIYYVKGVGAFSGKGITELVDEKTESELSKNAQSIYFNTLTGDTWYNDDSKQTFRFHKDGTYSLAREIVQGSPISSEGFWRVRDNTVELTSQKNAPKWYKSVDIIKTANNEIQLKQDGRTWIYIQNSLIKKTAKSGTETKKSGLTEQRLIAIWSGLYRLGKINGKYPDKKAPQEFIQFEVLSGVQFQKTNGIMLLEKICESSISFKGDEINYTMFIKDCSGNILEVDSRSVPRRKLIFGNREYHFYE